MQIHHPPAYCPIHGFFPAASIALGNTTNATFEGCTTSCPRCGRLCDILSGRYDTVAERLNIFLSAGNDPAVLEALRNLAREVQSGSKTLQDAQEQAERIKPGTGKLFDVASWSDTAKATLYAAIIGSVAVFGNAMISKDWSGNQPKQTVEVIVRSDGPIIKGHHLLTGQIPIPTPRPRRG